MASPGESKTSLEVEILQDYNKLLLDVMCLALSKLAPTVTTDEKTCFPIAIFKLLVSVT